MKNTDDDTNNNCFELFSNLVYYNKIFNAPFLYTPFEEAIAAKYTNETTPMSMTDNLRWVNKIQLKNLNKSIEMISMGKSYYEEIRSLYYLFDDFNDRRNHMSHTLQMLCSDFSISEYIDIKVDKETNQKSGKWQK